MRALRCGAHGVARQREVAALEVHVSPIPAVANAEADQGISRELLRRVASGDLGASEHGVDRPAAIRIWRPVRALALSRLDALREGAAHARRLATEAGFEPVSRVSGGHAVVLGTGSLCIGMAEAAPTFEGTQDRYERLTEAVIRALQSLGIDAERGELPGEWCPGAWSVRSGRVKLAGLAQRAIKGGAWAEAVIELEPDPEARALLPRVYDALDLPLDMTTVGSISELLGRSIRFGDLSDALLSGPLTS